MEAFDKDCAKAQMQDGMAFVLYRLSVLNGGSVSNGVPMLADANTQEQLVEGHRVICSLIADTLGTEQRLMTDGIEDSDYNSDL